MLRYAPTVKTIPEDNPTLTTVCPPCKALAYVRFFLCFRRVLRHISLYSPAFIASAITVSATDMNNRGASFTNWGPAVDIAAPGVGVNSSIPGGGFATKSGTSMAAPHVAAAAAMYILQNPDISPDALQLAFRRYVNVPSGWNSRYGSGILDLTRAIPENAPPQTPITPTPSPAPSPSPIPSPTPTPEPMYGLTISSSHPDARCGFGSNLTFREFPGQVMTQNLPPGTSMRLSTSLDWQNGYDFYYWEVLSGGVTINNRSHPTSASFIMPSNDVSIRAVFRYTGVYGVQTWVNDTSAGDGTIMWDVYQQGTGLTGNRASARFGLGPSRVLNGTLVSLRAVPNSGFVFDYWEVVEGNVAVSNTTPANVSFATAEFTMPSARVHIRVHFRRE